MIATGTLVIDKETVEWSLNEIGVVQWGVVRSLRLPHDRRTEQDAVSALIGWHQGYIDGKHAGRAILQNDFRNLMDCRKP